MNDREQNHLDVMTDMVDRCYTPGQYHTTEEQDAEIESRDRLHQALAAAHAQLYVTTVSQIEEPRK
jgi:hypothetical protein